MTCAEIQKRLSAYLDGELPADEAASTASHLRDCGECAAELESLKSASAVLGTWSEPGLSQPAMSGAAGGRSPLKMIVGLAAAALVSFAAYKQFFELDAGAVRTGTAQAYESDLYYVLRTQPEDKAVVVQTFDDFAVSRRQVGDSLQGHELLNVENDALTFENLGGEKRRLVSEVNEEAAVSLRREVAEYSQAHRSGGLNESQLTRLKEIAYLGIIEDGVTLLRAISESSDANAEQAKVILDFDREVKRLNLLAGHARSGEDTFRQRAVQGIAKTPSPLALNMLRQLAVELDGAIGIDCVNELARAGGPRSLGLLKQIATEAGDADVRARAESLQATLLKDMSNE